MNQCSRAGVSAGHQQNAGTAHPRIKDIRVSGINAVSAGRHRKTAGTMVKAMSKTSTKCKVAA